LFALAVAAAIFLFMLNEYRSLRTELQNSNGPPDWAGSISQEKNLAIASPQPQDLAAKLGAARLVIGELARPWGPLFQNLSDATTQGVSLLELKPNPGDGTLSLGGEAKDFETLMIYVTRLQQPRSALHLTALHHEANAADASQPLRFTLTAVWNVSP